MSSPPPIRPETPAATGTPVDGAPTRPPVAGRTASWRPSRRMLVFAASAFGVGLLLFALLWWRDRGNEFYRPGSASTSTPDQQQFEPLPAPLPADAASGNASGMGEPDETTATSIPPALRSPPAPPPPPSPPPPEVVAQDSSALSPPSAISSPPPAYPADAFRNGESGTVLLRAHVDDHGLVYAVDLIESSRSRSLDRAASEAVRSWRFRPAQRDGQAVSGTVQVPIAFTADR
ncbi:MAG: energy transducer TonB [Luteimonas sp.]